MVRDVSELADIADAVTAELNLSQHAARNSRAFDSLFLGSEALGQQPGSNPKRLPNGQPNPNWINGFFFGSSDGTELEDDLKFIAKAREALAQNQFVLYSSWW